MLLTNFDIRCGIRTLLLVHYYQVSLFCLAIGRDPKGMTIAVVNEEMAGSGCGAWSDGCLITSGMKELDMDEDWEDDWDIEETVTLPGQSMEGGPKLELKGRVKKGRSVFRFGLCFPSFF